MLEESTPLEKITGGPWGVGGAGGGAGVGGGQREVGREHQTRRGRLLGRASDPPTCRLRRAGLVSPQLQSLL